MTLRHRPVIAGTTLLAAIALSACALPFGNAAPDRSVSRSIFADEFDGPAGPVSGRWQAETGGGGWGNNEAQVYTADQSNVRIDGKGHLQITARYDGKTVTSARLTTGGKASITYGRVEARISLPAGAGLHPAFWLLGDNLPQVGWPRAGEIDVIETVNDARDYHMSIHAPQKSSARGQTVSASGPAPMPLAGIFHTYWMNKTPGRIETGIDDRSLFVVTPADLASDAQWVFDAPFHLLLTLAVGGDWPGAPNDSTPNPATMLVDWVRVTGL
ncbi:glycoside hydrolase family 16 protein [Gordonia sp. CPCC 205515]|uniref:glycoside hydrolase family 16 protein n=1 Tax=Gordonia sp. CPCC 205515 TaxID=3140791 RepID=UPI003AF34BD8